MAQLVTPPSAPPASPRIESSSFFLPDAGFEPMLRVAAFLAVIWLFGRILQAFKLPTSLGALAAGILLGPQGLDVVPYAAGGVSEPDIWRLAGNLGITLLIFEFGTAIDFERIWQVRMIWPALAASTTLLPIVCGVGLTALWSFGTGAPLLQHLHEGFAAGVALAPTSPVALRALEEEDLLKSLPGQTALVTTFAGITISLVSLAVLNNVAEVGDTVHGSTLVVSVTVPLLCSASAMLAGGFLARNVIPPILNPRLEAVARVGRVSIQPRDEWHLLAMFATLVVFATLTSTRAFGTHLLGTFIAGMCFVRVGRSQQVWRVQLKRIRTWCVRVFYAATVGFAIPVQVMLDEPALFLYGCLFGLVAGVLGKLLPCLLMPLRIPGDTKEDKEKAKRASWLTRSGHIDPSQLLLGSVMVARGEFSFLIAEQASRKAYTPSGGERMLLDPRLHIVVIWALVVAVIAGPLLLRWALAVHRRGRPFKRSSFIKSNEEAKDTLTGFVMTFVGRYAELMQALPPSLHCEGALTTTPPPLAGTFRG